MDNRIKQTTFGWKIVSNRQHGDGRSYQIDNIWMDNRIK